jgi:hypothetical protein
MNVRIAWLAGRSRWLRLTVLCAIVGSPLVGWLSWPAASPLHGTLELGRSCREVTRQWAGGLSKADPGVRRVSVLCRLDGSTHAVTVLRERPGGGYERLSWRPLTTFLGALPAAAGERVDIVDGLGRLVEYAAIDRQARMVAFHDASGGLTGSGRLDAASGRVERIDVAGERGAATVLPIPP